MSNQDCFSRNGNQELRMTPCSTVDGKLTHCCGDNYHCATNGLCVLKPGEDSDYQYNIGGCTLEDWDSDGCVQHCKSIGFFVSPCNNYNGDGAGFSCVNGSTNEVDCNTSRDMFFTLDRVRVATPSTSSATSSQTDPASSPTESGDDPGNSNDSGGSPLAIGLGVGLGVAAIAIIGLAAWFFIRRRRNRLRKESQPSPGVGFENYKPVQDVSANGAVGQWQETETPKPYQDYNNHHNHHNHGNDHNGAAGVYYEPAKSPPVYEAPGDSIARELPGAGENGR